MFPSGEHQEDSGNLSAPLYITIGPPNCGKTTWLRQQQPESKASSSSSSLVDIALDDQPHVYMPIPLDLFLSPSSNNNNDTSEHQQLLQQSVFQKTVQERLLAPEQQELRWVLQRLMGKLSSTELEESIRSLFSNETNNETNHNPNNNTQLDEQESEQVIQALLKSVEDRCNDTTEKKAPETVGLFVVEALFQKDASQNITCTGIERATVQLRQTPRNVTVAWGNTNVKPRDYISALEMAQQQHRPVYFCVFGTAAASTDTKLSDPCDSLFELPHLELQELVDRNIGRLVQTGRYIPSKVIWDMSNRSETLIGDVLRQVGEQQNSTSEEKSPTKFDLHRQLARLAQFDMQPDRTVKKLPPKRSNYHSGSGGGGGRWQQPQHNRNRQYNHTARGQPARRWNNTGSQQLSSSGRQGRGNPTRQYKGNQESNWRNQSDRREGGRDQQGSQQRNQNGRWGSNNQNRGGYKRHPDERGEGYESQRNSSGTDRPSGSKRQNSGDAK